MGKIYNKVVGWLASFGADKYLHFIVGLIIAAAFCIVFSMKACIVPVVVVAFLKEMIDGWRGGAWCWWDFTATMLGGAVIQGLVVCAI